MFGIELGAVEVYFAVGLLALATLIVAWDCATS